MRISLYLIFKNDIIKKVKIATNSNFFFICPPCRYNILKVLKNKTIEVSPYFLKDILRFFFGVGWSKEEKISRYSVVLNSSGDDSLQINPSSLNIFAWFFNSSS